MRWLAIASCAVVALATAHAAGAAGGHGSSGGRAAAPAHAGPPPHFGVPPHFHGGGTRVFIGGTFFVGPYPYYYWPGYWPGYYYPPVAAAPEMAAPTAYWYYCAPLAAYYPYVPSCPSDWQLVEPYPY
ncbi:MAG TPA: hypothetical protein VFJ70_05925 [Burkholderiales bacterium]|nr:hypothetical protein [Burkholderiales bacterium]